MIKTIDMTNGPKRKMSIWDVRKAANDCEMFAPTIEWENTPTLVEEEEDPQFLEREQTNNINKVKCALAPAENDLEITTPTLDTHTLRAILKLNHPELWLENKKEFQIYEEADTTTDMVERLLNAIQSKDTTLEEQALGFSPKRNSKCSPLGISCTKVKLNNWDPKTYRCSGNPYSLTRPPNILSFDPIGNTTSKRWNQKSRQWSNTLPPFCMHWCWHMPHVSNIHFNTCSFH